MYLYTDKGISTVLNSKIAYFGFISSLNSMDMIKYRANEMTVNITFKRYLKEESLLKHIEFPLRYLSALGRITIL